MSEKVSRRGVYRDLTLSPYEYKSPYGDLFKFASDKKLGIYTREAPKRIERVSNFLWKTGLAEYMTTEEIGRMYRFTYHALYREVQKDGKQA